jgi:ubiquinol-cytochrome c reductase cytochrome b subunit
VSSPGRGAAPRTPQGKMAKFFDERLTIAGPMRAQLNKVFPDHWSFMMGEIALYSFIILILTGTYLSFFYDPSMADVVYNGRYVPLDGITMSKAYESTLKISFDVRGGLIVRQIHHWSALLFVGAMIIHMCRVFFTGAFRKPRELNWLIGLSLLGLGIIEGFVGYSLPDDLLSGTGLRIAYSIVLSIPVLGTWIAFLLFGGPFPGDVIIGRFYIAHVLLIPGILAALIGAHLALLVRQKHTEFAAAVRTEKTGSGERVFPTYAAKAGGFFFLVFGVTAALGGVAQINPVWLYGPYNAAQVSSGSQPDWYMMFLDGSTRLMPSWEIRLWGYDLPPLFWPTVILPLVLFTLAGIYPFLEAKMTKDHKLHNLLQRPRDVPVRTSLGAMGLTFYMVLFLSGANDIIAHAFDISLNAMTWGGRIALVLLPPLAYLVAYRVCLGLQRHDREVLEHGLETGVIRLLPNGEFIEVHQPLGPTDEHGHGKLNYAGTPVPKRMSQLGAASPLKHIRGFFYPVVEKPEIQDQIDELEAADADQHDESHVLESSGTGSGHGGESE